jgi:hypothetical protein
MIPSSDAQLFVFPSSSSFFSAFLAFLTHTKRELETTHFCYKKHMSSTDLLRILFFCFWDGDGDGDCIDRGEVHV